ncbi:MAG: ABC transporter ATP-binding protein [Bacillota bacterium]
MSIAVERLSFCFKEREALSDVSFRASEGRMLGVIGPNGAGKSTLFRCILNLLTSYRGTITIDGIDARRLSAREIAHRIAYIPQSHGQLFQYSVLDMVLMGTAHQLSVIRSPRKQEILQAEEALERMGLADFAQRSFLHLSGGEQQLVLVARALAQRAKVLLMDEPTASLDYGNQSRVLDQVRHLAGEGYTVLYSTHNPQHALWYSDAVLALNRGRVEAFGAPGEVMNETLIQRLYNMDADFVETGSGRMIIPQGAKAPA